MSNSIFNTDKSGVFIRQAQFLIFPLRESFGQQNKNTAVVISSSGKQDDLRIVFRSEKNVMAMGEPNKMQVTVYNLSAATKQLLAKQGVSILLQTGYEHGGVGVQTIGIGGITTSISSRDGANVMTTTVAYDGMDGMAQAVSSISYDGSIRLKKIVSDLAKDMPGVEVSELNLRINDGLVIGAKGRVFSGRTSNLLSRLAREYGFSWTIDDGVFKAVEDVFISGNVYDISKQAGNLISANPHGDDIIQRLLSVDIATTLDPRIKPGDIINLKSAENPLVDGTYQVTSVSHIGDTHGEVWQTNIQCILNDVQRWETATSANAAFQGLA